MKKTITTMACFLLITSIKSQITITQSDLPAVGQTWYQADDSTSHYTIGAGGANQAWNFSTLTPYQTSSLPFNNLAATTASWNANFPGANMVSYVPADSNAIYFVNNSSGLYIDGFYDSHQSSFAGAIDFNPNMLLVPIPFTMNNTRNHVNKQIFQFTAGATTYKFVTYTYQQFLADAYGSLTTPAGTFANTLRIKELRFTEDTTYTNTGSGFQYLSSNPKGDTAISYNWLKNGANSLLLIANEKMAANKITGTGIAQSSTYFSNTTLGIKNYNKQQESLVFPNPTNGSTMLTINLSNGAAEELIVFDVLGQIVKSEKFNNINTISISTNMFNEGIYVYKIIDKQNREVSSGKFTVTK